MHLKQIIKNNPGKYSVPNPLKFYKVHDVQDIKLAVKEAGLLF